MMCFIRRFKIKRLTKKLYAFQKNRTHNPASEDLIKKEVAICHKLASIYTSLIGKKKFPFARLMVLECYRAASNVEDANSQFLVGKGLLDEAKFRDELQQAGIFASPSNDRQLAQLYEEAHAYLLSAENLNHIQAKRIRGLCIINGWGVIPDKKKGFDLIVESIEKENSWDKVPQIFAELQLNKPEFFSQLTQHRKTH